MIGLIRGEVAARDAAEGTILVDVGGVGYELRVSVQTMAVVPELGQQYRLFVYTHTREDQLVLYGFDSAQEKRLFRLLTSVPKVGPKNAIAVLGGFPFADLVECIAARDAGKLQRIPGIGKRTAEQIVLSLAEKLGNLVGPGGVAAGEADDPAADAGAVEEEAQQTLAAWGWKTRPAAQAVADVLEEAGEDISLQELLRQAMQRLTAR